MSEICWEKGKRVCEIYIIGKVKNIIWHDEWIWREFVGGGGIWKCEGLLFTIFSFSGFKVLMMW
jgi:hypothetical protein